MPELSECKHAPDCAENGCALIGEIINQSRSSGAKTAEQANLPPIAVIDNGPFWLIPRWNGTTSMYTEKASKVGCAKPKQLPAAIRKETQRKEKRRELV